MNGFQVELTGFQVTKYFYYTQARKMLGDSCSIPRAESDHQIHDINQESVAKKGVVSESEVERREDGGGAEPQERRSTSSQRAPSCPPHPAAWF